MTNVGLALYTASSKATDGRKGHVRSSDGTLDLILPLPKGVGGKEEAGMTNPEQLFSAGYADCFDSALQMVARQAKKKQRNWLIRPTRSVRIHVPSKATSKSRKQ
ncbi:hypothetical protein [Alkalibacterium indicireducens]|uniref:Peroxiredoxin, Ohr subfamily n=1 Tax=Alkalibacterium indicireducens TaxID=398758 RepID=A0ABN1AKQ8_9LACT